MVAGEQELELRFIGCSLACFAKGSLKPLKNNILFFPIIGKMLGGKKPSVSYWLG